MADRIMVDTNVLLYAYDRGEPSKQSQALAVLDHLAVNRLGVLTSQVLAEFFVNATRRLKPPLTTEEAYGCIQNYLLSWEILDITGPIVLEAVRGVRSYQMAYWDAQIWASAKMSQIPIVFSEDFGQRAIIEGVSFVNPFGRNFNLEAWLPGSKTS
ncbi:MAG: twitching motility protein PilT [Deltaproteobacteria bacterium RBG_16_49_23]|nr:MAG: twitching motility protein PilT [Deltaproteobacteria bacterium RBG_16_49_23]